MKMENKENKEIQFINKMAEKKPMPPEKPKNNDELVAYKWTVKAAIICGILLAIVYYFIEADKNPNLVDLNQVMKMTGFRPQLMSFMGNKNFLLLGVDSNGGLGDPFKGSRSDTILILNVDRGGKSINAISIPRDSKVYIAGSRGPDKINAAHAFGGPELTKKTIEETFGIHIDKYIAVDYAGVKDFVRAIGGVPIDVEKRMHYRDRTGHLNIDLSPGYQVLDADQAEGYLRFRHDAIGDIGRIKRQQWFVKAVLKKLTSPEMVFKVPQLYEAVQKNVRTDMNIFELTGLFNMVKKTKIEDIKVATLPGKPSSRGYISYWILDPDKTQEVIDRFIYKDEPNYTGGSLSVNILYSPAYSDRINDISDKISEQGFIVKSKDMMRNPHSEIIAHTDRASFNRIERLRDRIPELKTSQYSVNNNIYLYPGDTDYTIILAD